MSSSSSSSPPCSRSWSVSDESLRRYVEFASESCIQELLSASMMNKSKSSSINNITCIKSRNRNRNRREDELDDDDDELYSWKKVLVNHNNNNNNNVEISKRRSSGGGGSHGYMFRSRWILNSVSPQQFITVATAIHAAKEWDSDLVEGRYIKDLEDNLSIVHLQFGQNSKPLFRNRDFIVYQRRETMDDGTLVVAVASLPKEIAAGVHPKQNNTIRRGVLMVCGWVVEKFEEDNSGCKVTYVIQLDPAAGSWLPNFFLNRLNTKLVMIIDNLRKLLQPS